MHGQSRRTITLRGSPDENDRGAAASDGFARFRNSVVGGLNETLAKLPWKFLSGMALGAALTVGVAVGPVSDPLAEDGGVHDSMMLFERVVRELQASYVDEVDPRKLVAAAADGMLAQLDPYSEFESDLSEAQAMRESVVGRYGGVGLVIVGETPRPNSAAPAAPREARPLPKPAVPSEAPGEPPPPLEAKAPMSSLSKYTARGALVVGAFEGYAFDHGLRVGDRVVAIDGASVVGVGGDEVKARLRGPPDTALTLTLERDTLRPTMDPNPEDLSELVPVLAPRPLTRADGAALLPPPPSTVRTFDVVLRRRNVKVRDVKLAVLLDARGRPVDMEPSIAAHVADRETAAAAEAARVVVEGGAAPLHTDYLRPGGAGAGSVRGSPLAFGATAPTALAAEKAAAEAVETAGGLSPAAAAAARAALGPGAAGPVGYIQLSGFTVDSGAEVYGALRSLELQAQLLGRALGGIVLDLRGNPGGLLSSAVRRRIAP